MTARRQKIASFARRLGRNDHGTVAVEFAIGATITLALLFTVVDVGRVYIVAGLMGDATRQISRENQVRETAYTAEQFATAADTVIEDRAANMLDPQLVTITTTVYDSFQALADDTPNDAAPPGGDPGQIVKYRLTYDMDYYTPFVGLMMEGAQFSHVAEIIVYNEPDTSL